MSIEGQGHFFTIYFPGFVCFVLYLAKISGERLQDHWSSGSYEGPPPSIFTCIGFNFIRTSKGKQKVILQNVHSLWNNLLISISILRDYWLETMRDGHKHLLIYLDKCMGVNLNPLLRA